MAETMRAMLLEATGPLAGRPGPLREAEVAVPAPGAGEILIAVSACGVCHTELDEIEGRMPPPALPVIPGHEVVGRVAALGAGCQRLRFGDRVGTGWIHHSDGSVRENLSPAFVATGRDVNGGYAEYMTVREDYAVRIPSMFSDAEAAPLLCAGSVGYRALRLARLKNGEPLGLTGFGGSGHLVLQFARHLYPDSPISVFARSKTEQAFALELGAAWSGDTEDRPPEPLAVIIDTTPAWRPVLAALERLRPGGRLVINAIRKESNDQDVLESLRYETHLWMEKELTTVANVTVRDIHDCLAVAAAIPITVATRSWPLDRANDALHALAAGSLRGAHVLLTRPEEDAQSISLNHRR